MGYIIFQYQQKPALAYDAMPTKWEYKVLVFSDIESNMDALKINERLDEYGKLQRKLQPLIQK